MKRAGEASPAGKAELVCKVDFQREEGYLYFLDHHGDLVRAKRAVEIPKRKKPKPITNEPLSEIPKITSTSAGLLPGIDISTSHLNEARSSQAAPEKTRVFQKHQTSKVEGPVPNGRVATGLDLLGLERQDTEVAKSKDRRVATEIAGLDLLGVERQDTSIPRISGVRVVPAIAQKSRMREESQADVLIVTVTKVETRAVLQAFEQVTGQRSQTIPIGDRIYRNLGQVNGARVFLALSEMGAGGLGASQQAVRKGIEALRPDAVIMVGIAFGVHEGKQAIGDILVSQQLRLYDLQRVSKNEIILRGDRPHASPFLVNHLQSAHIEWDGATVCFGLMLSGEKLVDNIDYREQLKTCEPGAIGGEMEGAGLYVACHDAKVDWILVKSICDWADGNKALDKDSRQQQAAQNAASFLLHALQHAPLKRHRTYSAGVI